MSGTKFKVKKYEVHADSVSGAQYEFGAEINQDFPIEAPGGLSGKLLVNNDLEVEQDLLVSGLSTLENADVTTSLTATEVRTDSIRSDDLVLGSSSVGATGSKLSVLGTDEGANSIDVAELSSASRYGVRIESDGSDSDATGDLRDNTWSIQSISGADSFKSVSSDNFGDSLVVQGNEGVSIGINASGSNPGGTLSVYSGSDVTSDPSPTKILDLSSSGELSVFGTLGVYSGSDATKFLDMSSSGELSVLESDLKINGSLKSTSTGTALSVGESAQGTVSINAVNINLGSATTDVLTVSSDELRLSAPIVPQVDNTLEVKSLTSLSGPVGITVSKPSNGSSYLQVAESSAGSYYGGRLAYEGDSSEDMGVSDSTVALQGVTPLGVNTVLSFNRDGSDVKLESTGSLLLDSQVLQLHGLTQGSGNGVVDYVLGLGNEDIGGVTYTSRVVYDQTDSFFSAGHVYHSDVALAPGTSVKLDGYGVTPTDSSLLTNVAGIVASCAACSAEDPIPASRGRTLTEGFAVKVASIGDSIYKDCPGFRVCNENGAISAGDLLVTSSTPGYLMKQGDDVMRSCTVGKSMETVVFDDNGQATGVYGYIYCG